MSFLLTPRFAPAYQQCGSFACAPSRPSYRVSRQPQQSFPSFAPFLNHLEDFFGEVDREARHAAHQERQQRKRAFRARFDVRESREGYELEGEVPGFEQENISIEVADEHTLKIAGSTAQSDYQEETSINEPASITQSDPNNVEEDRMDGVTLNEAENAGSDTDSHKSYQATVEDDFEDLGAETSSTTSNQSPTASVTAQAQESKGKEKAVAGSTTENVTTRAGQQETSDAGDRKWLSERSHGSFERAFTFAERIDANNVRASLRNGILAVHVPKAPAPQVRQIIIQ